MKELILYISLQLGGLPPEGVTPIVCGEEWAREAGASPLLPILSYHEMKGLSIHDSDFLITVMAMITVESRWDPSAISVAGAKGLLQLTPLAVEDAANHCNLRFPLSSSLLFQPAINVRYGACYLLLLREKTNNWLEALVVYNGGYRQLTRLRKSGIIVTETAKYVIRILHLVNECYRQR